MIQDLQASLEDRGSGRMVQSGRGVEKDQGSGEDGRAHDLPGITCERGQNDENRPSGKSRQHPHPVGEGAGQFFPASWRGVYRTTSWVLATRVADVGATDSNIRMKLADSFVSYSARFWAHR